MDHLVNFENQNVNTANLPYNNKYITILQKTILINSDKKSLENNFTNLVNEEGSNSKKFNLFL